MPHEVIMPALGMAQDTGLIVSWHKNAGDAVSVGDVLFEVETDKATMEVEAQAKGFLSNVGFAAGSDVPVGDVIALISETAEAAADAAAGAPAAAPANELPSGKEVIMPALGMAQDTGLIVAWHKSLGDTVSAGDILFEVETDKATMEVEAGHDGFVAALLAEAGEAAPVGETIAIISGDKPQNPVQLSRNATPAPTGKAAQALAEAEAKSAQKEAEPVKKGGAVSADGRILASPKARRLALEQGLDLGRLVQVGHPQPYHAADIEILKSLPEKPAGGVVASAARRLTADLPSEGFAAFAAWAIDAAGITDQYALLAGLAAASLDQGETTVAIESFGQTKSYVARPGTLGDVAEADEGASADLIIRDLRMSRISSVDQGVEDVPILTLMTAGDGLLITLECASDSLTAAQAITLLSNFAGRMEQPLRHLL
ncbi:biotin/lipoyl-containing protein [Pseudophaeobacter flagellatus]|uniref:biotin/lipoyl-containing protein n=1 Tax=Pseudophaeobacter flagellatus TaxID=2899119 RepID=UPI001E4B6CD1|nr:biotin/lipoyl-containing protein [Pseudophaeobacter flagellatus]MCD9149303.1 pyruvate dehydrogenase [Pseudophaeobacter flagellatus]